MKNYLTIATGYSDTIRIYACDTTEICKHAQEIHNMWPTSMAALGRTLTLGLMMSTTQKNNERLTIKIDGGGSIGQITVETKFAKARGFVHNPGIYLTRNNGKLAVGEAVGTNGYMTVIRDLGLKEPYISTIPLQTGEIGDDATMYFYQSEQTNTAVALGVLFDTNGKVTSAGGYIIQLMPNACEDTISKLENILKNIEPISTLILNNSPEDIISKLADKPKFLDKIELEYYCDCSKEKFANGIKSLGKQEIKEMIDENKDIDVTCNFCNKKYTYTIQDLEELLKG